MDAATTLPVSSCQNAIGESMHKLIEILDASSLLQELVAKEIIPLRMILDNQDLQSNEGKTGLKKLLEHIANGNEMVFIKFINCLLATGQFEAVRILEPRLCVPNTVVKSDGGNTGIKMAKKVFRKPEYNVYPMLSRKKGYALIISNTKFEDHEKYLDRAGGLKDESNLKVLLGNLGFEVCLHQNVNYRDMRGILFEFKEKDHLLGDAAIIVVLSHGDHDGIVTVDGRIINPNEIIDLFTVDECQTLAHKPKLFFFGACRGARCDDGQVTTAYSGSLEKGEMAIKPAPKYSDMKICYSSHKGYKAMRHPEIGTWFIASIFEVFGEHAHDTELDVLMQIVAKRVREIGANHENPLLQTIEVISLGWENDFYFNPGIYINDTSL